MKPTHLFCLLLLGIFSAAQMNAQWVQTNGPEGGYISALAFLNNELLAIGDGPDVLYVSGNYGHSWARRPFVPLSFTQRTFVDGAILFVMGSFGVFMSTDAGITWSDRSAGLSATTLGISMARLGDRLFLGCQEQPVYGDAWGALYQSSDLGASWERIPFPFVQWDMAVESILVVDTVIVAGGQQAIYRSTDRGASWTVVVDSTGALDLILHTGYVFAGT